MGQVKKDLVRDAVLASAARLFESQGYHATTITQIAAGAKTAGSNVYVYFPSKFQIAVSIYKPWLEKEIEKLERDAMKIPDPRKRLYMIIHRLWLEIPAQDDGFTRTFIEALSSLTSDTDYSPSLLVLLEDSIQRMIGTCLPAERKIENDWRQVAHILMMAFDGFAIYKLLHPTEEPDKRVALAAVRLILGP